MVFLCPLQSHSQLLWETPLGTDLALTDVVKCILSIFKSHATKCLTKAWQPCSFKHQASGMLFHSHIACIHDRPVMGYDMLQFYIQAIQSNRNFLKAESEESDLSLLYWLERRHLWNTLWRKYCSVEICTYMPRNSEPEQSASDLLHMDLCLHLLSFMTSHNVITVECFWWIYTIIKRQNKKIIYWKNQSILTCYKSWW